LAGPLILLVAEKREVGFRGRESTSSQQVANFCFKNSSATTSCRSSISTGRFRSGWSGYDRAAFHRSIAVTLSA
ncbi:MAG: hypothetical protein WAU59_18095, partial [Rhodoplanes sp.]